MPVTGPSGWFLSGRNNEPGWRLDVVSLLAVIGDSSLEANVQRITVSWLCLLPRLIPAPHTLLKENKPQRLKPLLGFKTVGAFSGFSSDELTFTAALIHQPSSLRQYEFQEWAVGPSHRPNKKSKCHGQTKRRRVMGRVDDIEKRSATPSSTTQSATPPSANQINQDSSEETGETIRLVPNTYSPANFVTLLSSLWSIGILAWALKNQDGVAALAVSLLSLAASLVGIARKWEHRLDKRYSRDIVPDGDLVLRSSSIGAFVVVHCHENIARALYTGLDHCDYLLSDFSARIPIGIGTIFIMVGVVLLGNCSWVMQAVIGATYLTLNGAYWLISLMPERAFWHLEGVRAYNLAQVGVNCNGKYYGQTPAKMLDMDDSPPPEDQPTEVYCYTRTLWYTILQSQSVSWVKRVDAVPESKIWDQWLGEAYEHVENGDGNWTAVRRKGELLRLANEDAAAPRHNKYGRSPRPASPPTPGPPNQLSLSVPTISHSRPLKRAIQAWIIQKRKYLPCVERRTIRMPLYILANE